MDSLKRYLTTIGRLPLPVVLLIVGAAGFYLGCVAYGDWQLSVESAQVLAGVVPYRPTDLTYIHQIKLWSLLNQLPALFLYLGISEAHLSLALSGLIGMIAFQSIAFLVWALSRNPLWAIISPFVIFLYLTGGYLHSDHGRLFDSTVYPIYFTNTGQTYGAFSLPFILLIFGAFGSGMYRSGAFLLGIAPAVHSASGVWCLPIFFIALFLEYRDLRGEIKKAAPFFLAGAAVAAASLVVHLIFSAGVDLPSMARGLRRTYLTYFIANVDLHRQPVKLLTWGMLAHVTFILFLLRWLSLDRDRIRPSVRLMLKAFLITAAGSIVFSLLSWRPDLLPLELLIAMPGRLQNFVLFAFGPLLIGLLGSREGRGALTARILLQSLLMAMLWVYLFNHPLEADIIPCAVSVAALVLLTVANRSSSAPDLPLTSNLLKWTTLTTAASAVVLTVVLLVQGPFSWKRTLDRFQDWSNSGLMARIHAGRGMLLTGPTIYPIQIMTRRPVLVNGGFLNFVSYLPETAPHMDVLLKDLYGVDVFTSLQGVQRAHGLNSTDGKYLWEGRTEREWQALARKYNFSSVLTYGNWHLNLPVDLVFDPCILYRIPE